MSKLPNLSPEEFVRQAGWMGDLARSLLADPSAAEDVVQEAWVAALLHPPLADRPIEGWLARVVRNFAWKRRRGDARRAEHEQRAVAAIESVPGPAATAERLELQRSVLDALEAIPEPFRTTVVERYLEGRSSADIARALGVPEGTVRWRLKRGLAELRARLDACFGERATWCALLAPLARAPIPVAASSAASGSAILTLEPGVLAMVGVSKIVLAATLGVAAVGLVLWRQAATQRGAAGELEPADSPPVALAADVAPTQAARPSLPQREAPTAAPRESSSTESAEPAAAPEPKGRTDAQVSMRFVDALGAPWKDVRVSEDIKGEPPRVSGADGRVELRVTESADLNEWNVALVAHREGCATRRLRAVVTRGRTTSLGDVLLGPGSRIEGRVLDERGVAFEGAEVGLSDVGLFEREREEDLPSDKPAPAPTSAEELLVRRHGSEAFDHTVVATSVQDGAFALEGAPVGHWRLWAHGQGTRFGWSEPFEVRAGENLFDLEVRVPALLATDRIRGIVLDPAGAPAPGAMLTSSYEIERESGSSSEKVGDDGRFEIVIRRDAIYTLLAEDEEKRHSSAIVADVVPGGPDVVLRLGEKRFFEVLAHDRDGRPLEECRFVLRMSIGGMMTSAEGATAAGEPGLYSLELPRRPFELCVRADGFLPARFEDLRPETVGARFDVVLDSAPRLRGRVLADGRPVPNARIELHRAIEGSYWRNGFACLYDFQIEREGTSDSAGRFDLSCESTASTWLRASAPGWVAGELGPLDPASAGELVLELTAGGAIEGRVLLPNGADAAGVVVGISHGDGHARTLRADAEGRFRFEHLVPGHWQVLRREEELDPSTTSIGTSSDPQEIEWTCTVEAGRTTHHDLDLSRD